MKFIDKELESYAINKSNRPSKICDELEGYTRNNIDMSQMLVGKMEASFLGFLIKSLNVKNIVEFGTFTGYSALAMAEALPEDGTVTTFDINTDNGEVAKRFWSKSESSNKITQIIGPALESIQNYHKPIDLAFIDADKVNYLNYLNACLDKLSPTGIIVIDNVLWSGNVLKPAETASTKGIQEVNDFIANNDHLYGTLLPIRDGMFLIKKL